MRTRALHTRAELVSYVHPARLHQLPGAWPRVLTVDAKEVVSEALPDPKFGYGQVNGIGVPGRYPPVATSVAISTTPILRLWLPGYRYRIAGVEIHLARTIGLSTQLQPC